MTDRPAEDLPEKPEEPKPVEITEDELEDIDAGDGGQQTYPPYL